MDTSKYKGLYLQEAREHISGIEDGLLAIEKDPTDAATVDKLFRHYHTIKGMSASMGFESIQKFAHAQENLLDKVRSKSIGVSSALVSTLFECLDQLKDLVNRVDEEAPLDVDITPFLKKIEDAARGREGGAPKVPEEPTEGRPSLTQPSSGLAAGQAEKKAEPESTPAAPAQQSLKLSSTMKVDGRVFDDLLVTVGELFMELTSFRAVSQTLRSIDFKDTLHMLGKSISKLHSSILTARMLPLEDLTAGLPRLIRDMSVRTGKAVRLNTSGADISLDRSMLENLGGPLVHMIRNSIDHGIEGPDERRSIGKDPEGTITIKAYGRKDHVVIEVSDDGRGIDVEKIKVKAASKGISTERLSVMTRKDLLMLVCMPGFTTSAAVTDTSGRGVGMDVVKSAIEGLSGKLVIDSVKGSGTIIRMELPRTTSIMKTLLVSVSDEFFLIPISKVEKVLELDAVAARSGFMDYDNVEIPLLPLGVALGVPEEADRQAYTVVVVEDPRSGMIDPANDSAHKKFVGIRVDDFGEEIDAYIKPLLPPMSKLRGVSGITITGDGRPVFLVDIANIISMTATIGKDH